MDLRQTIRDLLEERKRLDSLITRLERMQSAGEPPKRRGRRGMNDEQRREVSERMKRYWEQKRRAAS